MSIRNPKTQLTSMQKNSSFKQYNQSDLFHITSNEQYNENRAGWKSRVMGWTEMSLIYGVKTLPYIICMLLYLCQLTDRDHKATASIQKRRQPCKTGSYRIQTHISDRSEWVTTWTINRHPSNMKTHISLLKGNGRITYEQIRICK